MCWKSYGIFKSLKIKKYDVNADKIRCYVSHNTFYFDESLFNFAVNTFVILNIMCGMNNLKFDDLKNKKFHFIGIGGISMSGLAFMLMHNQIYVQGSDLAKNQETEKLEKAGVKVFYEHKKENVKDVDIVVYTSAIKDDNEELVEAKQKGKIILKRAELLGLIAGLYKYVIAISGSHGKTTTTAMIAEILMQANKNPTIHIGGNLNSISSSYKLGGNEFFVTEACEYKDNYLYILPDIAVVLNIDADHLDYFKDLNGVKQSFEKFALNTKQGGIVVISKDDLNSKELTYKKNCATFGFDRTADVYASRIKEYRPGCYSFDVRFSKYKLGNIKLNILGKHNILNALVSILVSICIGIDFEYIKIALENFSGVERRCQFIKKINGVSIYHDYAHHPKQIEKMIKVGRELVSKTQGRVIVVFEPHTFSRTKFLIDEFVESFNDADILIFAPVYSAREKQKEGFDSLKLLNEVKMFGKNVFYFESFEEIKNEVLNISKVDDVVLLLGAGTIEKLAKMF